MKMSGVQDVEGRRGAVLGTPAVRRPLQGVSVAAAAMSVFPTGASRIGVGAGSEGTQWCWSAVYIIAFISAMLLPPAWRYKWRNSRQLREATSAAWWTGRFAYEKRQNAGGIFDCCRSGLWLTIIPAARGDPYPVLEVSETGGHMCN